MSAPALQLLLTLEHRESKRSKIYRFFESNVNTKFSSKYLHDTFGSSFRTRVSEVNRDSKSQITIRNEYVYDDLAKQEASSYWSEPRN